MAKRGAGWSGADGRQEEIKARRNRRVQIAKTPRNAFGVRRQEVFLEMLAATCNVQRACAAAEVSDGCVYSKRRRDPRFREAWSAAIETGMARIEAMLIERAMQARPPEVRDGVALPAEPIDIELAKHLLREHRRGESAAPAKRMAPRGADWSEVEAHFTARLRALRRRIDQGNG